jgi:hypothetical protein
VGNLGASGYADRALRGFRHASHKKPIQSMGFLWLARPLKELPFLRAPPIPCARIVKAPKGATASPKGRRGFASPLAAPIILILCEPEFWRQPCRMEPNNTLNISRVFLGESLTHKPSRPLKRHHIKVHFYAIRTKQTRTPQSVESAKYGQIA